MLYNTSMPRRTGTPSKSRIVYNGLETIGAGGTSDGKPVLYRGQRLFGIPVRFSLDEKWRNLEPRVLLARLGIKPERSPGVDPLQQLIALINRRAEELPLPDGCIVMCTQTVYPAIWSDPLTSLAILSKSSDTLWLRSKTPSVLGAMNSMSKTLIVPPSFASYLPEVKR